MKLGAAGGGAMIAVAATSRKLGCAAGRDAISCHLRRRLTQTGVCRGRGYGVIAVTAAPQKPRGFSLRTGEAAQ